MDPVEGERTEPRNCLLSAYKSLQIFGSTRVAQKNISTKALVSSQIASKVYKQNYHLFVNTKDNDLPTFEQEKGS